MSTPCSITRWATVGSPDLIWYVITSPGAISATGVGLTTREVPGGMPGFIEPVSITYGVAPARRGTIRATTSVAPIVSMTIQDRNESDAECPEKCWASGVVTVSPPQTSGWVGSEGGCSTSSGGATWVAVTVIAYSGQGSAPSALL